MEKLNVIIEASARHCHLTEENIETLFGKGYKLTPKKDLSQPGQYLCEERVTLIGPKGEIKSLGIIGPARKNTQVELSLTDARTVGITAPIRESGDVEGTPGCKIVGPCGEFETENGVMIAMRHIHVTPEDAEKYGLKDKQIVSVKVGGPRATVFCETVVRVSEKFQTRMHVDFDENNGAALTPGMTGEVIVD